MIEVALVVLVAIAPVERVALLVVSVGPVVAPVVAVARAGAAEEAGPARSETATAFGREAYGRCSGIAEAASGLAFAACIAIGFAAVVAADSQCRQRDDSDCLGSGYSPRSHSPLQTQTRDKSGKSATAPAT